MDIRDYRKICKVCDDLLLDKNSSETTISIPLLHVVRDHPVFLKQYEYIFNQDAPRKKNIVFLGVKNFIKSFFSSMKKGFLFNNNWVSTANLKKSYDYIFVSHLINEQHAGDDKDFYYDFLPRDLSKLGYSVLIVLINHSSKNNRELIKKWKNEHVSRLILSQNSGILDQVGIYFKFFRESIRLFINYSKETDVIKKSILELAINQIMPSINNLQFALLFNRLSKVFSPKNVIITFEGHGWERLAFSNFRKYKSTNCIAYQHALLFKNQHSVKRDLQKVYNPDIILTSGKIAKEIFLNSAKSNQVIVDILGSNRTINKLIEISPKSKKNAPSVLVLPEGTVEECLILFEHSYLCAISSPDIYFIWRLHPLIKFSDIYSTMFDYKNIPSNIKLSSSSLDDDISESNFVLYRGSTAIINCVMHGLTPLYLDDNDTFNIDPLYGITEGKFRSSSVNETINCINSLFGSDKSVIFKRSSLIEYASNLFNPLDINKLIKYSNL